MEERYFVDDRTGCIAVRDREDTDPEYPGLHPDTQGVVWFRDKPLVRKACRECGHESSTWFDDPRTTEEAKSVAAELNTQSQGDSDG